MEFSDYRGTLDAMREALNKDIKAIITKHGREEASIYDKVFEYPVIRDSDVDDGIVTLDAIRIANDGSLLFDGSNSYEDITLTYLPVEYLLDIKEIVERYEDDIFSEEEEED